VSGSRESILARLRGNLNKGPEEQARSEAVAERLAAPPRGPLPARGQVPAKERLALFTRMAEEVEASVTRLATRQEVPAAVANFLRQQNAPLAVRLAPQADLGALPWSEAMVEVSGSGPAEPEDKASVTGAFAAVAETGTLMLLSGAEGPSSLNFLPDYHLVVLDAKTLVGTYEEAWERLRARQGGGLLPRTVNFITGPSRSADIEQTIQLGAHGPRRLHILIVGEAEDGV
jgi:L-lactate dehydrogenase complex protein LldG